MDPIGIALAAAGIIVAAIVGVWQIRLQTKGLRSQAGQPARRYASRKQRAYKEMWERAEELHLKLRVDNVSADEYFALLRDLNSFLMRKSLLLDEADRQIAQEYVGAVHRFRQLIILLGGAEAKQTFSCTGALPMHIRDGHKKLRLAEDAVDDLRNRLIERVRAVLDL